MKVTEVMTRGIDMLDPSATVQTAATHMAELDVGAVFIGSAESVDGVLTDRDIILRVVVEGLNPKTVAVGKVMSPDIVGCSADDTLEAALAVMRQRQFRRMPVFDESGKAFGVVTLSDVAKHVESPEGIAESLREMLEPHRNRVAAPADDAESASKAGGTSAESEDKPAAAAA